MEVRMITSSLTVLVFGISFKAKYSCDAIHCTKYTIPYDPLPASPPEIRKEKG
jgi:hypothetical protein